MISSLAAQVEELFHLFAMVGEGPLLGMVVGVEHGEDHAVHVAAVDLLLSRLLSFGMGIEPVTPERAVRAALIEVSRKIPYADAFGVELAAEASDHVLVTADFDLKPATRDVKIEFLPRK